MNREAVLQLFEDIAPRYIDRPGGYTRVIKHKIRKGDGAPMALIELIESEMPLTEGGDEGEEGKRKGPLGWFSRKK